MLTRSFVFVIFVMMCCPAFAGDEGLYDPRPPEGAAFVRFINSGNKTIATSAGGKLFDTVSAGAVSPYYVVTSGFAGDIPIRAGKFYTVHKGKAQTDPHIIDPAKSLIIFYNFSSKPSLSLKTSDGHITIIDKVKPETYGARAINPLDVRFSLYDADNKIADITSGALERGKAYSIFAIQEGSTIRTIWNSSTTKVK